MSIEDKLVYLSDTKEAIRQAIVNKGVSVGEGDTFRSYAARVGDIEQGGGGEVIAFPELVGVNNADYATTTSLTVDIPSEAQEGDTLVIFGFVRSEIEQVPGWSEFVLGPAEGGTAQQSSFFSSTVFNGTDTAVTVSQASSERMALGIAAFRSDRDIIALSADPVEFPPPATNQGPYVWPPLDNPTDSYVTCIVIAGWSIAGTALASGLDNHAPYKSKQLSMQYGTTTNQQNRCLAFVVELSPQENIANLLTQRFTAGTGNEFLSGIVVRLGTA